MLKLVQNIRVELGLRQNLKLIVIVFVVVLEDAVERKSVMPTSALEHVGAGRWSVWEELPSSPETFGLIPNYDCCDDVGCDNTQWDQRLAAVAADNISVMSSSSSEVVSDVASMQSSDSATVPECEPSVENVWLDLDEVMNDVIMDAVKLTDIGLYLPPVSADDVDSLLSSPFVSAGVPAAASGPSHADFPECHEQSSVSGAEVERHSVDVSCLSVVYENQSSPESSESCISMPASSDRKQRKKEQNKTAAQKYRQKKRGEQGLVMTEYEQLERKNIELHTRVEEMTREVHYLKGLIEEICAA